MTGDHENRVTDYTAVAVYPTMARTLTAEHDSSPCVDRGQNVVVHDKIYQNTGVGWWNEATVAETLRTPCGGDAIKANLVIEKKPPRKYIVRRLTPLECCRLQGYPDGWTENLGADEPTEEEIEFFAEVWARWAEINGVKPKSRNAVFKWLQAPASDSAQYKAYGNSLAIPCSSDVLGRIAAFVEEEEHDTKRAV